MLDINAIIDGFRGNAILSIDLGVEDYVKGHDDTRRYVTALRNIYGGLLLLYKSHLAFLSRDQECCIIRDKMDWEVAVDGSIKFKGLKLDGKTLDVHGILDALRKFKIVVDGSALERIRNYRNQVEHLFDVNGLRFEVIRAHVIDLLKLVRDFTTHVMRMNPAQLYSDKTLSVLVTDEKVVEKERADRIGALDNLDWYEPFVENVFADVTCPHCHGEFLFPEKQEGPASDTKFVCRTCGAVDTYENLMSYYTDDIFIGEFESHICTDDKRTFVLNTGALWECPECSSIAFDTLHGICLVCGHKGKCAMCDESIKGEDVPAYTQSGLCSYCYHRSTKGD